MLKLRDEQWMSLDWILHESLKKLPSKWAKVDRLLDELLEDPQLIELLMKKHVTQMGRPTYPIEKYLRLMYVKFHYGWGYETLVKEVGDSFTLRRFCRIALDEAMPDSTTLIKMCKRYGEELSEKLNQCLVKKLTEQRVIRHRKLRTDTTVTESNIHHPTDATLLQDGVRVITRIVKKIRKGASHAAQGFEDQTQKMKEKVFSLVKVLRRRTNEVKEEVKQVTQQVVEITECVCEQAKAVVEKMKNQGTSSLQQGKKKLIQAIDQTEVLIQQAKQVIEGHLFIPDRIVSFFDQDARPIKKGKISKKTEFGFKTRIDETESGFVTGYDVYKGNPCDEGLLISAVEQHQKNFGKVPHAVATDRGFSSQQNEKILSNQGVRHLSMPKRGKKSKQRIEHEQQLWFRNLQCFRAGGEAKISLLKRKYGLGRSRYRGLSGTKVWVGMAIFAHNLQRAAILST